MNSMLDARTHFCASFDVISKAGDDDAWLLAEKAIRAWISGKERKAQPPLEEKWFRLGGIWKAPSPGRSTIQTSAEAGHAGKSPGAWSMRYEEADSTERGRRWRTDIGLERFDGRLRFSIRVSNWLLPTFVGPEPQQPVPTSPRVVATLLRSLECVEPAGTQRLSPIPIPLEIGEGHLLERQIFDPGRRLPLIYVTQTFPTGGYPLDTARSAAALAGVAFLVVAASNVVDKETEQLLPHLYRCWGGRIRIYLPGADAAVAGDDRRHRFFGPELAAASGPDEVHQTLVRSITRWTLAHASAHLTSLEDIEARSNRTHRQQILAAAKSDKETIALYKSFEDDLKNAEEKALSVEPLKRALFEVEQRIEDFEATNSALQKELHKRDAAIAAYKRRDENLSGILATLPDGLEDVLNRVQSLCPDRIFVTDEAIRAAHKYRGEAGSAELWNCVWAVAHSLYDLYDRSGESGNIAQTFQERTGFELALTEGKQTKKQNKMMRERDVAYKGQIVRAQAHVKIGADFRLYYYWHPDDRLIVIGPCGDHLTTAGTRFV